MKYNDMKINAVMLFCLCLFPEFTDFTKLCAEGSKKRPMLLGKIIRYQKPCLFLKIFVFQRDTERRKERNIRKGINACICTHSQTQIDGELLSTDSQPNCFQCLVAGCSQGLQGAMWSPVWGEDFLILGLSPLPHERYTGGMLV